MKIQPVGMWATPTSEEELQKMVKNLNEPGAYHAMMWTWNYLASLINEEEDGDQNPEHIKRKD